MAVADFNGDGKLDLAVTSQQCCETGNYLGGAVSILLGNGDGTFQNPTQLATTDWGPDTGMDAGIIAADLNNDGIPDIAAPDPGSSSVMVFLGNGDGTFRPVQRYAVGKLPLKLAVGDFNKDGKPDLIVGNFWDGTLSVLLGNGDGTFKAQSVIALSSGGGCLFAEFDPDRRLQQRRPAGCSRLRQHGDPTVPRKRGWDVSI